jgi:tRNA-guanine family transglycosylase
LRHLFMAGEILAHRLASIHNLFVLLRLMDRIRDGIGSGSLPALFADLRAEWQGAPL